jgi:hypothetical protein
MLPIFLLAPCAVCDYSGQGTRAKGGNSIRCAECGVMRRVPVDRPTAGPDDPRASRPQRGRPLKPGHPYRFRQDTPQGGQGASVRPSAAPAYRPAPAARAAASSAPTLPRRRRAAGPRFPEFSPYVPCDLCADSGRRNADGIWHPAAVSMELREEVKGGVEYVNACFAHLRMASVAMESQPHIRLKITRNGFHSGHLVECVHTGLEYDREIKGYQCGNCGEEWSF